MPRTICLDFNGVLDTYAGWMEGGDGTEYPPRAGTKEFLEELQQRGWRPIICTTIKPFAVSLWLRHYGLEDLIHDVTNTKPMAIAYVDDRAIRFDGDYGAVLDALEDYKTHWEKNNEHR